MGLSVQTHTFPAKKVKALFKSGGFLKKIKYTLAHTTSQKEGISALGVLTLNVQDGNH